MKTTKKAHGGRIVTTESNGLYCPFRDGDCVGSRCAMTVSIADMDGSTSFCGLVATKYNTRWATLCGESLQAAWTEDTIVERADGVR